MEKLSVRKKLAIAFAKEDIDKEWTREELYSVAGLDSEKWKDQRRMSRALTAMRNKAFEYDGLWDAICQMMHESEEGIPLLYDRKRKIWRRFKSTELEKYRGRSPERRTPK